MAEFFPLLCFLLITVPLSFQQETSNVDLYALNSIKNSFSDLPGSNFFSTWNFPAFNHCSTFSGIVCSFDSSSSLLRVTTLTLGTGFTDSPGLTGSLSPALANLSALTQLILYGGSVSGPIPPQLGNLKNLRLISLTNNKLSGEIPNSIATLPNLHTLDLSFNKLTGSIPSTLFNLPSLKILTLSSNCLFGEIKLDLLPKNTTEQQQQLLHLDLKKNFLSGKLPLLPSSLRYLSVAENQMWSTLDELESLSELVYLDLSMNKFSGTIPQCVFNSKVSWLQLQRNNLSGEIPKTLPLQQYRKINLSLNMSSSSSSLEEEEGGSLVDLSHNDLSGELSRAFTWVQNLFLNNNRFTGSVPIEYMWGVFNGTINTLYLQHNYFTGFPSLLESSQLPNSASLCLSYNCVEVLPSVLRLTTCPSSAGKQVIRPLYQCTHINNLTKLHQQP